MGETESSRVSVTDFQMPFWSMVKFTMKWAIASLPALIVLVSLGAVVWTLLSRALPQPAPRADAVSSTAASTADTAPAAGAAAVAYLPKVMVSNVSVGTSDAGEPAVFAELKNTGERSLKRVEVTIYCLGLDGSPVFEKKHTPVLFTGLGMRSDIDAPLKPGYSRQFGVRLYDAPSEWNKEVRVSVTGVEFE